MLDNNINKKITYHFPVEERKRLRKRWKTCMIILNTAWKISPLRSCHVYHPSSLLSSITGCHGSNIHRVQSWIPDRPAWARRPLLNSQTKTEQEKLHFALVYKYYYYYYYYYHRINHREHSVYCMAYIFKNVCGSNFSHLTIIIHWHKLMFQCFGTCMYVCVIAIIPFIQVLCSL